jgi:hypothetical protein
MKADGTYSISGLKEPDSGKWTVKDRTISFVPEKKTGGPPSMALSDDGTKLVATVPSQGKPQVITMVKG